MSHESKLQPHQHPKRPGGWEGWKAEDSTLALLLEQALRIKEEVAAGLQSSRDSIQVEALSRKLLENHILTITRIVKQLSSNIQVLERQIIQRDSVTSETTTAVQNMDLKNNAGIGDLRGRVARCDADIAKLSVDVNSGEQQVIRLQKDVSALRVAVDARLKQLEVKLHHDAESLEASLTKYSQNEKSSKSDLQNQIQLQGDRMSDGLKDAKEQIDLLRRWTEQQLNKTIHMHAESHQQLHSLQDKMLEAESRLSDRLHALELRVERFETQRHQANHSQSDRLKRSEAKLEKKMTSVEIGLQQQLQLLKQEYHTGFLSVRDAIDSLKQICDIKSRLDKEKLQKDIRHILSKVPELSD